MAAVLRWPFTAENELVSILLLSLDHEDIQEDDSVMLIIA